MKKTEPTSYADYGGLLVKLDTVTDLGVSHFYTLLFSVLHSDTILNVRITLHQCLFGIKNARKITVRHLFQLSNRQYSLFKTSV